MQRLEERSGSVTPLIDPARQHTQALADHEKEAFLGVSAQQNSTAPWDHGMLVEHLTEALRNSPQKRIVLLSGRGWFRQNDLPSSPGA